jgi:hypothetical protein
LAEALEGHEEPFDFLAKLGVGGRLPVASCQLRSASGFAP